jgi:hypothetical protein
MYDEDNKHCNECICRGCELRGTDNCLEGNELCNDCKNEDHTSGCVYFEVEDWQLNYNSVAESPLL